MTTYRLVCLPFSTGGLILALHATPVSLPCLLYFEGQLDSLCRAPYLDPATVPGTKEFQPAHRRIRGSGMTVTSRKASRESEDVMGGSEGIREGATRAGLPA